jgi:Cu/Zn superoxide dismutase
VVERERERARKRERERERERERGRVERCCAVIESTIYGLRPGPHGHHVHEYGDLRDSEVVKRLE